MDSFRLNPTWKLTLARGVLTPLLRLQAEAVKERAQSIARAEAFDTGDYHDSIDAKVELEGTEVVGYAFATDWKALLIEKGTIRRPASSPLRRAKESLHF